MMGTVDRAFLDSYLAAWNAHDSAAVARHMADDAVYEDVALGACCTVRRRLRRSSRRPRDHRATSGLKWCPCSGRATITRMNGSCSGRMTASCAAFLRPAARFAFGGRRLEGSIQAGGSSRIATTTTSRNCSRNSASCRLRRRSVSKHAGFLQRHSPTAVSLSCRAACVRNMGCGSSKGHRRNP